MRIRKQEIGAMNMVGQKIEERRKELGMKQKELLSELQVLGIDLNPSGLSKLEGQLRGVTDYELKALALALKVSVDYLLGIGDDGCIEAE